MKPIILFLSSLILLSSCKYYSGDIQSSAQLNRNNFIYIGNVEGSSKATYFLGFGGLKHKAMINEAKQELYKKHPLRAGQAYVNITTDISTKFWLVGFTKTCIINADVVQFLETRFNQPDTSSIKTTDVFNPVQNETRQENFPFKPGDFVSYKSNENIIKSGKILLMTFADSTAVIESIASQNSPSFKSTIKFSQLIKPIANKEGLAVNDKANILIGDKYFKCVIISTKEEGANVKLLEEPQKDKIIFAPYNILKKE